MAPSLVAASQHSPRRRVHKVDLPAREAGQGFETLVIRPDFFCREALHVEAGVWTAVDERGHGSVVPAFWPPIQHGNRGAGAASGRPRPGGHASGPPCAPWLRRAAKP
jgi:hypothetical protein